MAAREYRIKGSHIAIALLLIAIIGIIYWQAIYVPTPKVPKYTTGLIVKFNVYDASNYTLCDTGDVVVEFYGSAVDPIGSRTFTTSPLMVASYDATNGYWRASLDAGTYVVLVKKGTTVIYPEKFTVTVSGTDSEDREVWLNPAQLNVYERVSTLTVSHTITPYNTTGYYSQVESINTTLDASQNQTGYWMIEYRFLLSDTNDVLKSGRFYWTKISNLIPTKVLVDGSEVTWAEDTDASDDGMSGYYVSFSQWKGGELHSVTLYVQATAATSGALTLTVYDYYDCRRIDLRTWTVTTDSITVEKASS
jgi:hypothetical protein